MGSPVSPIVANLYMEEVERRALTSHSGTAPSHWYRYVDDTQVKIKTQEVHAFSEQINAVDKNIKFTHSQIGAAAPFLQQVQIHLNATYMISYSPSATDPFNILWLP